MAETKLEVWQRKVAHKAKKEEERRLKEKQAFFDAIRDSHKPKPLRTLVGEWTTESIGTVAMDPNLVQEFADTFKEEIDKEILKTLGVPKKLL